MQQKLTSVRAIAQMNLTLYLQQNSGVSGLRRRDEYTCTIYSKAYLQ